MRRIQALGVVATLAMGLGLPAGMPLTGMASATTVPAPPSYVEGTDAAAPLFDPLTAVSIDFSAPQASLDALWIDPKGEYQLATMTVTTASATYGPWDVGLRLKGGWGSFRDLNSKSGFKVKLNHVDRGRRLLGLKKLTLNNMVQDPTMMREALGYRLFRAMGVSAPRVGYATVTLNGSAYGLYANIETPDSVMLPRWFDSTQHLYEGAYWNDVWPGNEGGFEVDEGDEEDRSDLTALIAAANLPDGEWWTALSTVADREQMTRMWALEAYTGHADGYTRTNKNNYYLHSDDSGRFAMLPWGIDQTFFYRIGWTNTTDASILFTRCMATLECRQMYDSAIALVTATAEEIDLLTMSAAIEAALLPQMLADPRREYDVTHMESDRATGRAFIAERPAEARAFLASLRHPAPQLRLRKARGGWNAKWKSVRVTGYPILSVEIQVARRGQSFARIPVLTAPPQDYRIQSPAKAPLRVRVRTVSDLGPSPWSDVVRSGT